MALDLVKFANLSGIYASLCLLGIGRTKKY